MKNMITMMIGIVIGAITILIILTVTGRMNYATELESQLPAVVENILCNVKIKQLYNVADNQEFTADVTEQIAKELDAQTGIVMRIMGADKEKGLFSEFLLFATCLPIQSGCISQYRFFHSDA